MRAFTIAAVAGLVMTVGGQAAQVKSAVPQKPDDRAIVHVLNRLGFGAAPGDVERVRTVGLATYIDRQLQPERIDDAAMATRLAAFETLSKSTQEMAQQYYVPAQMARRELQRQQAAQDPAPVDPVMTAPPQDDATRRSALREMMTPEQAEAVRMERQALTELMQAKLLRAAYSDRQLEEVMVDFWFNHFNVFSGKGQVRVYLNEYERDAIRPHVLGTFRELLQATAESPAMLFYLDNWQSSAPEGARTASPRPANGRVNTRNPNRMPVRPGTTNRPGQTTRPRTLADLPPGQQNRRAGLNENYARELMELHTLGVEGGYTQKDVQEVARAFTGWTIANPRQGGGFRFEPRMHDDGEKIVLGHTIKSGGGKKDGDLVLDFLATHPSTAQFIATKLARRFVADEPPKALVERAARRFRDTGGNIREVVRVIVTSPEFIARTVAEAAPKRKVLVTIFQRGAVDGLNMIVPFGERDYYAARPSIAIARPGTATDAALDLDGFFGMHPRLAPLKPLYDARQLAIVHACGSPDGTRSHFDAQDYMETATPGIKSTEAGWLNRYLHAQEHEKATPFRAVAMASQLPRALQGLEPALAIGQIGQFGIRAGQATDMVQASFEAEYAAAAGSVLNRTGREAFDAVRMLKDADPSRYAPDNGAQYPRTPYGDALKQIAQLIKADVGLEVAFAETGNWDHHAQEGAAVGQLANRLSDFAGGIAALVRDLGDRMSDVLILTMSEFGRTVAENGNRGTDHGHGNAMMVVGGGVRGGKVYGKWPGLAREQRYEGRDLAVTTDFRTVFAEVAGGHLGLTNTKHVFPGFNGPVSVGALG